jgi:hypothetical protein
MSYGCSSAQPLSAQYDCSLRMICWKVNMKLAGVAGHWTVARRHAAKAGDFTFGGQLSHSGSGSRLLARPDRGWDNTEPAACGGTDRAPAAPALPLVLSL